MDSEDIYGNLPDIDFGGEVEKLKLQNQQFLDHIGSLEKDIEKLCHTLVDMKKKQINLEKNISELFNTARREIQRKDQVIADLRIHLDDLILRRQGITTKRNRDNDSARESEAKRSNDDKQHYSYHHKSKLYSGDAHRKSRDHDHLNGYNKPSHDNRSHSRESKYSDKSDKDHNKKHDRLNDKHRREKSREHYHKHREPKLEVISDESNNGIKCSIDFGDVGLKEVPDTKKEVTNSVVESTGNKNNVPLNTKTDNHDKPKIDTSDVAKSTLFTARKLTKIDQASKKLFENVEKVLEKGKLRVEEKNNDLQHKYLKNNPQIDRLKSGKRSMSASEVEKGRNRKVDKPRSTSEGRALENTIKNDKKSEKSVSEKPKDLQKSQKDKSDNGGKEKNKQQKKRDEDKDKKEVKEKSNNTIKPSNLLKDKEAKTEDKPRGRSKSKEKKVERATSSNSEKKRENKSEIKIESSKIQPNNNLEKKRDHKEDINTSKNKVKPAESKPNLVLPLPSEDQANTSKIPEKAPVTQNKDKGSNNTLNTNNVNLVSSLPEDSFLAAEFQRDLNGVNEMKRVPGKDASSIKSPSHKKIQVAEKTAKLIDTSSKSSESSNPKKTQVPEKPVKLIDPSSKPSASPNPKKMQVAEEHAKLIETSSKSSGSSNPKKTQVAEKPAKLMDPSSKSSESLNPKKMQVAEEHAELIDSSSKPSESSNPKKMQVAEKTAELIDSSLKPSESADPKKIEVAEEPTELIDLSSKPESTNEENASDKPDALPANDSPVIADLQNDMTRLEIQEKLCKVNVENFNNNNNNNSVIIDEEKICLERPVTEQNNKQKRKRTTKVEAASEDYEERKGLVDTVMATIRSKLDKPPAKSKRRRGKTDRDDKLKKLFYSTDEESVFFEKAENEITDNNKSEPAKENQSVEEIPQVESKSKKRTRKNKALDISIEVETNTGRRVLRSAFRKTEDAEKIEQPLSKETAPQLLPKIPGIFPQEPEKSPEKRSKSPTKRRVTKFVLVDECDEPIQKVPEGNPVDLHNDESLPVLHIPDTESNSMNKSFYDLTSSIEFEKDWKLDESAGLKTLTVESHASAATSTPVCVLERLSDEQITRGLDQLRDDLDMSSFEQSSIEGQDTKKEICGSISIGPKRRRVVLKMID